MRPLRANCEVLLRASNNQSGGWNGGMISADLREEEAESGFAPSPCCPPWGKHRGAVQKRASPALPGKPLAACQPNWVNTTPRSLSVSLSHTHAKHFLWFWKYLHYFCMLFCHVNFIYIMLFTIHIVSKQLYRKS